MRDSLTELNDSEKFNIVAKWFALAPLEKMSLDPENSKTWQDPWTLISNNKWCEISVAIAIEATLRLGGAKSPVIAWIIDRKASIQTMVVIVDNCVLNYEVGHVVAVQDCNLDILYSWQFDENSYVICDFVVTK
jgi:hypothetical protein